LGLDALIEGIVDNLIQRGLEIAHGISDVPAAKELIKDFA
jgi:hypothetical protein